VATMPLISKLLAKQNPRPLVARVLALPAYNTI
jgi:hypothetical protein